MEKMQLLNAALTEENLFLAWEKVRDNAGSPGIDGISIESFGEKLFGRLITLKKDIEQARYVPQPLLGLTIPKENGKLRQLAIPTVRDRIAQTAVARVLTPVLEKEFEAASFGYRPGRSVAQAVERVARYRDEGYRWVVDADIQGYFDHVDHAALLARLREVLKQDLSLLPLIELWLAGVLHFEDGRQPVLITRGIPQGSPLSPLLANLYLDELDEAMLDANLRLVRFADDFIILCRNREDAEDALELSEEVLGTLKLKLNEEKTRITHFDQGFAFLGVQFVRDLLVAEDPQAAPWVLPKAPQEPDSPPEAQAKPVRLLDDEPDQHEENPEPDWPEEGWRLFEEADQRAPIQRTLYVHEQGVALLKEHERISVAKRERVLVSLPLNKLDQIVIFGNAVVSTALLRYCHKERIAVHFHHWHGEPAGSLDQPRGATRLQARQFECLQDDRWAMNLARASVTAKIHNMHTLLQRYRRNRQLDELAQHVAGIERLRARTAHVRTLNELRGCEGMATRHYFHLFRSLLPDDWGFAGRNRQPPRDLANALLSYGYGILYRMLWSLITRRGLNPWLGALHAPKAGFAALAADLMEEFRAPVVDSAILQLGLSGKYNAGDFLEGGSQAQLSLAGRKLIVSTLEARLRVPIQLPRSKQSADYQRLMAWQVGHYARVLLGDDLAYSGFHWR